ncbi:MAG: 4-hydroxy-3-methylbut-2-enyl diphosphate reductase [Armatimonadetes bacterium]|nr:4-hydroxy-3-methylbut-2-enyl diphosphate reductase [Armatimonadota bacterium]
MQLITAKSAGFCYGVRRALDTVMEAARIEGKRMYTLGPLIHNPQVVERLAHDGVQVVSGVEEVPGGSLVVMPSHGVPESVMSRARELGLEVVDVTCPFVSKVQNLARELRDQGYQVVILGDAGHTEVRGIMSSAGDDALVVSSARELRSKRLCGKVAVVAQTTQTLDAYVEIVREVVGRAEEVRAFNTICHATSERQTAAVEMAREVDVVIVVGGRNSANTRRLAEMCSDTGVPTHHIETAGELNESWLQGAARVGLTAGASTPDWIINEVAQRLMPPTGQTGPTCRG